ncbi:MAG: hypothetical protein ACMUIP_13410 [bacterium]
METASYRDTQKNNKEHRRWSNFMVILINKIFRNIYLDTIGVWYRFRRATSLGKLLALAGLIAAISAVLLTQKYALKYSFKNSKYILVTSATANIRASDSTKAKVLFKVKKGARLIQKGESKEWWHVQRKGWKRAGWISKDIAKLQKKKVLLVRYEMKGYVLILLASFIMIYAGLCLRRI